MAGERNYIGPYRLLRLVRSGATCQIWEVINDLDGKRCALKTIQDVQKATRDEVALLKHEYQVGHELRHPHVIEIYDFNVSKGIPYLALEYFESSNLKQWLRQQLTGETTRGHLTTIIQQAAEGLQYLHSCGWLHRDVKPDNFLVNSEPQVKLIDFAITERIPSGWAKLLPGRSKVQGTRSYMSPEQIRGERLDVRSDVYSFGCMLFELFCGRPPFTGGSPDELLQKHLKTPVPSIVAGNNEVSTDFANLVTRMMSKQRDQRPSTMQEFLDTVNTIRLFRVGRN